MYYCTVSKTHRALFHLKGKECGTFRLTDRPEEGSIVGEWDIVLPDDGAVNLTLLASIIQAKLDKSWAEGEVFDLLGVWRTDGKVGYYLRSYGEDA